jgi:nicotinamide riboside kinase
MMNEKLTYEEWRKKYVGTVSISEEARKDLKEFHNIDADEEIEQAFRKEYEIYVNGELHP